MASYGSTETTSTPCLAVATAGSTITSSTTDSSSLPLSPELQQSPSSSSSCLPLLSSPKPTNKNSSFSSLLQFLCSALARTSGDDGDHDDDGSVDSLLDDGDDDNNDTQQVQQQQQQQQQLLLQRVSRFSLPVHPDKGYRATQLQLWSTRRPHMRAFHASWMCFFAAWLLWFSVAPLLPSIQTHLQMTKQQVWTSNLWSMAGAVVLRFLLGPLCDQYGGRTTMTSVLAGCSLVSACTGLVTGHSWIRLVVVRTLVGCVGGTLVPAQFWITSHFVPEICGTTMALVAGWGAMGGGVAQIFMGSFVFPRTVKLVGYFYNYNDNDMMHDDDDNQLLAITDLSWRIALLVPSVLALTIAILSYLYSDDYPLGNIQEVQKAGLLQARSAVDSFRAGAVNLNAWLLFLQFAAVLGIELVMEAGISTHLSERFDLSLSQASAYASLFGLMNIFARGFGGYISDKMHRRCSLQGRLGIHWMLMVIEACLILVFCHTQELSSTLVAMMSFAMIGQMAMGTCFGIVPYIDPANTGSIAGIVGAGGNAGAIWLSHVFQTASSDFEAFRVMAIFGFTMSLLTPFIVIRGYRGICFGTDRKNNSIATTATTQKGANPQSPKTRATLLVPRNGSVAQLSV